MGPGSTRTTLWPRFFNSIAEVTPLIPAPTTIIFNDQSRAGWSLRSPRPPTDAAESAPIPRAKRSIWQFGWPISYNITGPVLYRPFVPRPAPPRTILRIHRDKYLRLL